ncbi:MAG: dienelactone hydrolase family protein [Ilumatobacteraceae bacterium]|nr:dienelactone hydrolase family protein [Ilumatobacteraceae bacterium]
MTEHDNDAHDNDAHDNDAHDRDALLAGWAKSTFTAAGFERDVYRCGTGPGIVIVHEIPGITPKVTAFANEVVAAGFTVVMPSLVGTPGRDISNGYVMQSMAKVCVAREFSTMALNQTSPIIGFLRALARNLHNEVGGPGVGALGMCFSGGFALGMMIDDIMVAPVLSQPSMPFVFGIGKKKAARSADLNLSPDDVLTVTRRAAEGCQVLGLRYTDDPLVGTRFETLRTLLGDAFIAVELPSATKRDHSVLTEQRDEPSVQRVLEFFAEKLKP